MTLLVVEVAHIIPDTGSDSVNSLTIPLTFFDLPWLLGHPFKQVFFYKLTESTREHFHSFILPKLKLSLSLVLRNYLPLAGCLVWNENNLKPSIVVSQNDAVLVKIAETDAHFSQLSGYGQRPLSELNTLIPELPFSDTSASAFSLQITLFPNQGFSIGFAAHHAVLDGKTASVFIKAWAHLCKQQDIQNQNRAVVSLPQSLTPSLDRSLIKDLTGLDEQMIEIVKSLRDDKTNLRSLNRNPAGEIEDDDVLATLVLSNDDVERLRERCRNLDLHLSTFVIAYAYAWTCFVEARGGNRDRTVSFLLGGDFRSRLDPPIPATYFGNCLFSVGCYNRKAADFTGEEGFVTTVEIVSDLVKSLSSPRIVETIAEGFAIAFKSIGESSQIGSVAMSNKFGFYESDFGWGKPVKVDFVSIRGEGIALAERRDEEGGVEIGMCMEKTEMDKVFSFFNNGLQK